MKKGMIVCSLLLSSLVPLSTATAAPAEAKSALVPKELAQLRRATAPFHSLDVAMSAGWSAPISDCIESPAGGMGFHYGNPALLDDGGALDPYRPEALLYEPTQSGGLRFVGVEYIIPEADLPATAPAPSVQGQLLHFNPTLGLWILHAWVWKHNPAGIFEDFNPRVSCQYAD